MFCKHCGHKLTNSDTICPGCGTQIDPAAFGVQNFKVQLPSHEKELQALLKKADAQKAAAEPAEAVALPEEPVPNAPQTDTSTAEEPSLRVNDDTADAPLTVELPEDVTAPEPEPVPQRQTPVVSNGRAARPYLDIPAAPPVYVPQRETRSARRSRHLLIAAVCLCMLVMLGLLGVRLGTTLFDSSNSGLEPVSLSILTDEEKTQILSCLMPYAPLFDRPFKPQTMGVGAFFDLLDLNRINNLYAAVKGQPTRITDKADPLNRFADGEGGFSYYRIARKELDEVAARFGVSLPGSGNNSSYYYHDGAYYFAADAEPSGDPALDLHVGKAQHTEDGNYYVSLDDLSDTAAVYAILSRSADAAARDPWSLLELSPEPLFRDDGTRIAPQSAGLSYEMRHESIQAAAADGTVYANYVLDYPYFTDETAETSKTINALYAQMLASYKELAQSADKNYGAFVKHEYDTRLLPAYTYMVSTVTYNEDGTVSLLDELTEYHAETAAKALKAQQSEASPAQSETEPLSAADFVMPTITYSGTTVDTASGAFLRRDDVFSGDFEWYQSLLFRIFAGADEEELDALIDAAGISDAADPTEPDPFAPTISEDVTAAPETTASVAAGLPALSDAEAAIGQQIYASPWVRTEEGVRFCYLGNGYYTYVTLPQKYVEAKR